VVIMEVEVSFSKQARLLLDRTGVSDEVFLKKFEKKIVIGGVEVIEFLEGEVDG